MPSQAWITLAMDWKIVILLGAILPLGTAIEHSGLAAAVGGAGMKAVGTLGPLPALLMLYLLTEPMGHNPSVVPRFWRSESPQDERRRSRTIDRHHEPGIP